MGEGGGGAYPENSHVVFCHHISILVNLLRLCIWLFVLMNNPAKEVPP